MTTSRAIHGATRCLSMALCLSIAPLASAQAQDPQDPVSWSDRDASPFAPDPTHGTISAGDFVFRPELDLLIRTEAHGALAEGPRAAVLYSRATTAPASDSVDAFTRGRLGLGIAYEAVRAQLSLETSGRVGAQALFTFAPRELYVDLATKERDVFFRLGRQVVIVGDGRLIGDTSLEPTGRSMDAARLGLRAGDFDIQALGALLELPKQSASEGALLSGAQLYAVDATWHLLPWLKPELTFLARTSRNAPKANLTPADTFVVSARAFGDYRGVRYSALGALEFGRFAIEGALVEHLAGAAAARASWKTALPWSFTFGVEGAYATGDSAPKASEVSATFDPLFPDSHVLGQSGLMAWTNQLLAGGDVAFFPVEELGVKLAYRYLGMADAQGTVMSGDLRLIGRDTNNTSTAFGHLAELEMSAQPWSVLRFSAAYSLIPLMDGGRAILKTDVDVAHFGMLDARFVAP